MLVISIVAHGLDFIMVLMPLLGFIQVTVNSGGVVFFALFNTPEDTDLFANEAAAVIKIASSRMATQSERLGYEFAKWLGVHTPQVCISVLQFSYYLFYLPVSIVLCCRLEWSIIPAMSGKPSRMLPKKHEKLQQRLVMSLVKLHVQSCRKLLK